MNNFDFNRAIDTSSYASSRCSSMPVINVADLRSSFTQRQLDFACRHWGSFQIIGHGIDTNNELLQLMKQFFSLSTPEKQALSRTRENHWGYYDKELTQNCLDRKQIYDYGRTEDDNLQAQWPEQLPQFKAVIERHFEQCENLALNLLSAIAANLGVASETLERCFKPHNTSFLRLNYYPVDNRSASQQLGIHPHTDAGALTLLLQDQVAGLELFREGDWCLIEPVAGALTINLGDIIQVWSNDRYMAPLHRVRASHNLERYSAPFFLNPSFSTYYQPLSTTVDVAHPPIYQSINWGEFRERRAAGDYQDLGKEIQISDFKIN